MLLKIDRDVFTAQLLRSAITKPQFVAEVGYADATLQPEDALIAMVVDQDDRQSNSLADLSKHETLRVNSPTTVPVEKFDQKIVTQAGTHRLRSHHVREGAQAALFIGCPSCRERNVGGRWRQPHRLLEKPECEPSQIFDFDLCTLDEILGPVLYNNDPAK